MAFPTSFKTTTAKSAAGSLQILKFTGAHVGKSVQFLAFIESFTQSFQSTWNSEVVYGRNDPIGTFQSTQRTMSLSWTVPAENAEVAIDNLDRCASLAQLLYPSYSTSKESVDTKGKKPKKVTVTSNALTLSKAPLMRIGYANLISGPNPDGLLGWISNYTWTPVIELGMFDTGQGLYPKAITLSIDFSVLHEQDLGWLPSGSAGGFGEKAKFPFGG